MLIYLNSLTLRLLAELSLQRVSSTRLEQSFRHGHERRNVNLLYFYDNKHKH